jgi:hypothetical protein
MTRFRPSRLLPVLLPLLLAAASCPSVDEDAYPILEVSVRRIQGGRIEEGIAGFEKASERLLRWDADECPVWLRPFMMAMLQRPGIGSRLEFKNADAADYASLRRFLGCPGGTGSRPQSACDALRDSGFHEQPGRWSRIPPWALPELLRLCANSLLRKAVHPDPVLPPMDDVPSPVAESVSRAALTRAALHYLLRAWEVVVEQKTWERDGRIEYCAAAERMSGLLRDIAGAATSPEVRARRLDEARMWRERVSIAQENTPLRSMKISADVEFVRGAVRDHFEDGLKSHGSAVEELSGRGMREMAEEQYRRALEHLLTAREFKSTLGREEEARMEFATRAVRGLYRMMTAP